MQSLHNLRKLPHKNYLDESLLDSPTDEQEGKCPFTNLKKKDAFPIYNYKKTLTDATEYKTQGEDVYEFIDVSPKAHKPSKRCRQHNSPVAFDKDTYEILKKLEQKEAKANRKVATIARQKKKLACNKKSYDNIVDKIVSNVMQKVLERKNVSLTKVDTSQSVEQNTNVPNNSNQDYINRQAPQKVHVNNFQEANVTVHNPSDVACSNENPIVKDQSDTNISTKQKDHVTVTRRKPIVMSDAQSDNDDDNMFNDSDEESDTNFLPSSGSFDNSVPQRGIGTCFGFDDMPAPYTSTPTKINEKSPINIMCNVRRGVVNSESSVAFDSKRPNANSTRTNKGAARRTSNSSPWRVNSVNVTYTPYFFSVKDKALPRMDQEMVINHTMVDNLEAACSNTPRKEQETPVKKPAVQQSILDFVNSNSSSNSNIEKQNEILPHSLYEYDYEAFNSPEKKTPEKTFTSRLQNVSRMILVGSNIESSTPVQRTPLADISNSSEGTGENNAENVTYFGFDENSRISPVKQKRNSKNSSKENDGDNKPSRFDVNKLRSYSKESKRAYKSKPINVVKDEATSISASEDQDTSVSIFEASNEETVGDICLFEEPEEMLDKMSPVHLDERKPIRRRRYNSCGSDTSDCEKMKKRHKKTKLEIEQEAWIKDFNKMCTEIDEYELELE